MYAERFSPQLHGHSSFRITSLGVIAHKVTITTQDKSETVQTLEQFITSHPFINGIEITNCTNDLGKVFFKPDSANIIQAHDFIDRVVKDLYVSDSMPVTMVFPNFNPPHQGDAPLHGTSLSV